MTRSDEADLTSQNAGKGVIRNGSGSGREILCLAVAVVFVGAFAIMAIVLAAVALGRPNTPVSTTVELPDTASGTVNARTSDADKIWVFAIGHDGTNLEYIHDLTGTIRGFHVDIVEAVCSVANKNCRLMWDVYENCYMSQAGQRPRPGVGLVSRWYDGCTGWFATYERSASVSFTKPFRQPLNGVFWVKQNNPDNFDSTDITGETIGFLDGHAANEFCIQRAGITGGNLPSDKIVHYTTREEAVAAVNNGEVGALFANDQIFNLKLDLDIAGDPITTCMQDGAGMMVRKDSAVPDWWNPAFDQLKQTSEYRRICEEILINHDESDHEANCVF